MDRRAVEERLGPCSERLELLAGGGPNLTVRVGSTRVLKVNRRSPEATAKEAWLLGLPWKAIRVPRLLQAGADYLLQEWVPHQPLLSCSEHARALGLGLAEIHRIRFGQSGFLGPQGQVASPFPDLVEALVDHMQDQLDPQHPLAQRIQALIDDHRESLRALSAPVLLHGDYKVTNLPWCPQGLLVLDWEFAYAGAALMDVGQLTRWSLGRDFLDAFAAGYREGGGELPQDWERWAALLDLFNLADLLAGAPADSRRARDVGVRIEQTLRMFSA